MDKIKSEYNILIKKYGLPSFDKLDKEFEIRALEENRSGRLVKAIIRVIAGKLRGFLEILDPVVNPNPNSIHSMIAVNNLSESIRNDMYDFYKKIGTLYQECSLYDLEEDKLSAEFIKKLWTQWSKIKKTQKKYIKLIINTWSKEIPKQKAGYHG
jgi:hypothetical protein